MWMEGRKERKKRKYNISNISCINAKKFKDGYTIAQCQTVHILSSFSQRQHVFSLQETVHSHRPWLFITNSMTVTQVTLPWEGNLILFHKNYWLKFHFPPPHLQNIHRKTKEGIWGKLKLK
jgi:hypothetical protein